MLQVLCHMWPRLLRVHQIEYEDILESMLTKIRVMLDMSQMDSQMSDFEQI